MATRTFCIILYKGLYAMPQDLTDITKIVIQDFLDTPVHPSKGRMYQEALRPLEQALIFETRVPRRGNRLSQEAKGLLSTPLVDHLVDGLFMGGAHVQLAMKCLAFVAMLHPAAANNEKVRAFLKEDFEHRGYAANAQPVLQTIATVEAIKQHPPFAQTILPLTIRSCIERPATMERIVENDEVFYVNASDILDTIVHAAPETAPEILNAITEDNILPVKLPENGLRLFSKCAGIAPSLNAKAVAHFEKVALAYRQNGGISFGHQQRELSDAFVGCAISLYRTVGARTSQMMAGFKGVSSVVRSETAVRRINAQTALGEKLVALLLSKRPESKDFLFDPSLTQTFFVELNKDGGARGLPPRPMPAEIETVMKEINPHQG